jgi:hypothetical protein
MPSDFSAPLPGYKGYEFQKLVTVWLGLKIMFEENRCDALTVEPASAEDVAAQLEVKDAASTVGVTANSVPLEIQIKSRGKNWAASTFGAVIGKKASAGSAKKKARGPAPRPRAIEMLQSDPQKLFLLITNAQLDPDLTDFRVREIGERSSATTLSAPAGKNVPGDVWSRIGIFPVLTVERVELEIDQLLKKCGHVPAGSLGDCRKRLINEVHLRLLGSAGNLWPKGNIAEAMRVAGGLPPTQSAIVAPTNFRALEQQLDARHSVLLTGGPGLGKTEVARELVRLHRLRPEPFEKVDGAVARAETIREVLDAPGAHIFLFEDPWGSDRLAEDADYWASELPKLMRRASAEKRFVVTSRDGIRHEALRNGIYPGLTDVEVKLEAAHYPEALRWEIVQRKLEGALPWQHDWAARHREKCLRELTVPLSLDHFCSRLRRAMDDTELKIEDVLHECNVDALAQACGAEIRARGTETIAASLVLWALHHARQRVTIPATIEVRDLLRQAGYSLSIDPEKTLGGLVNAGWFKRNADGCTAHPTCLTGIAQFLVDEGAIADDVLRCLLIGLVSVRKVEEAFRILRHLSKRPSAITASVRQKIEDYLVQTYLRATTNAAEAMAHVVAFSQASDPVTTLLKALDARKPMPKEMASFEKWGQPALNPVQTEEIRGSENAETAARIFVLHVLPEASMLRYDGQQLVGYFREFGWDFGLEFRAQAEAGLIHPRGESLLDVFVAGALLSDNPPFDPLLDQCLVSIENTGKEWDNGAEERRAANQSERDAGEASHIDDEGQELFTPRIILRDIIAFRRRAEGWRWLEHHPRRDDLLDAWAEGIGSATTVEELADLIRICGAANRPTVWKAIAKAEKLELASELVRDLQTAPLDELSNCAEQLACLFPLDRWNEVVAAVGLLPLPRKAAVASSDLFRADDRDAKHAALAGVFNPAERAAFELSRDADPNELPKSFDLPTRDALQILAAEADDDFAARAVLVLARQGEAVTSFLPRIRGSASRRAREWALFAGLLAKPPLMDRRDLKSALADPEFRIRRNATLALSWNADAYSKQLVIGMSNDPSAPVREACAEAIGREAWPEGQQTLVKLLRDRRDKNPSPGIFVGSRPDFHVARAAADAMTKFTSLDRKTITGGLEFLKQREVNRWYPRDDVEVHRGVMIALSRHNDERLVPTFLPMLADDWYVEGDKYSGYPLRYAAAWGLHRQLNDYPERASLLDLEPLIAAAKHDDGRLAGPCLILLAGIAHSAPEPLLQVCGAPTMTPARALLALANLPDEATAVVTTLRECLGADHPALALLAMSEMPTTVEKWDEWLAENPRFAAWGKTISGDHDQINPALRWSLGSRFPSPPPKEFFSADLQTSLVPRSIKSLTTWSMFNE